jgi:hypothetical protein
MSNDIDKLVRVYVKIRDKRAELSKKFDEEDGALKKQLDKVSRALLDYCKENQVESGRTVSGTFYRKVQTKYWTNDWESMNKFILENEVPEFFERRLHQSNVQQFMADNPDKCPPGLNINSEYTISVKRAK